MTEGHLEKIEEQAMVIQDYRETCDMLKKELKTWKDNVTSKDQKLTESMTQLTVKNCFQKQHPIFGIWVAFDFLAEGFSYRQDVKTDN